MSRPGAGCAVADRENVRVRRAPLGIDLDEALLIQLDAGAFQANIGGVGPAADGELIGKSISDVILAHDVSRLHATIAAVERGDRQTQVWPMVCKDGAIVQLEVSVQMLSNGAVLAVVRDLGGRAVILGTRELRRRRLFGLGTRALIEVTASDDPRTPLLSASMKVVMTCPPAGHEAEEAETT